MYDPPGPGLVRRQHPQYLPAAVAIMLATVLITIFVLHPETNGYGGGNDAVTFWVGAGILWAGTLIGFLALVFRSV